MMRMIDTKNIAKSEQSSHTPGSSHQRQTTLIRKKEKWINKETDKPYLADSLIHNTTCHI